MASNGTNGTGNAGMKFDSNQFSQLLASIRQTVPSRSAGAGSLEDQVEAALRKVLGNKKIDLDKPQDIRKALEGVIGEAITEGAPVTAAGHSPRDIYAGYFNASLPDLRQRINGLNPELEHTAQDDFSADRQTLLRAISHLQEGIADANLPVQRVNTLFRTANRRVEDLNERYHLSAISTVNDASIVLAANFEIVQQHLLWMESLWESFLEPIQRGSAQELYSEILMRLAEAVHQVYERHADSLHLPLSSYDLSHDGNRYSSAPSLEDLLLSTEDFIEAATAHASSNSPSGYRSIQEQAADLQPEYSAAILALAGHPDLVLALQKVADLLGQLLPAVSGDSAAPAVIDYSPLADDQSA